jgi:ribonuclease BN (tRNA processing enzyme)
MSIEGIATAGFIARLKVPAPQAENFGDTVRVKLTVVGCSPAWPNPGGAQSGYLIEADGRLLLDCGPGVLARLRELDGGWPQVDAIALTHFHLDHWGDLVPWAWGGMYGPGRQVERPELWVPPGGQAVLRGFGERLGFVDMFDKVFRVHEYADGKPFQAAGLEVTPMRVPHYDLLTFGMRVANASKSLAYSGDSAPSPCLADLARGVDLFLCEATLAQEEPAERGHLTMGEALDAFHESGAHRLVVIHRPHELPLADGVECAHDGWTVTL